MNLIREVVGVQEQIDTIKLPKNEAGCDEVTISLNKNKTVIL